MSKRDTSTVLLVHSQHIPKETIMPKGVEVAAWQEILERLQPHEHFVGCNPFTETGKSNNRIWVASQRGRLCPVFVSAHTKIIDAVKKVRQLNRIYPRYIGSTPIGGLFEASDVPESPATEETGL
jgi:hypothetical protein